TGPKTVNWRLRTRRGTGKRSCAGRCGSAVCTTRSPLAGVRVGSPDMKLNMGQMSLTAVFLKAPEGYVGFVEELPGANTQGATLDEARANLQEAVALVLAANRQLAEEALRDQQVIREPFSASAT